MSQVQNLAATQYVAKNSVRVLNMQFFFYICSRGIKKSEKLISNDFFLNGERFSALLAFLLSLYAIKCAFLVDS